MPHIKLKSSDDKVFSVDFEVVKCSRTIRTIVEDLGLDDNDEEIVLVPKANANILSKIIQWATYHKDDPPTEEEDEEDNNTGTVNISSWDADFLRLDQSTLFQLMIAADFLDIKGLMNVTSRTVANMIMGKSPEEIRTLFNIKNDFTAEEVEQIRRENAWCEDNELHFR